MAEIESLGYKSLWIGESTGNKEVLVHSGLLLSASKKMVIATGIANIWARDAVAMNAAANALSEAYDNRFLLGLGVSHSQQVQPRGHEYNKPLKAMADYLDAMDAAPYISAKPSEAPMRVLAALGPKMLELARERSGGAHTYFVPPSHTRQARQTLQHSVLLAPEQAFILEKSPARAREIARAHMRFYLQLPNYTNNLRGLGFSESDLQDGGSDRLVDSIVAWGDIDTIADRIQEHLDAGADHVAIQPLAEPGDLGLDQLRALAPAIADLKIRS